MLRGRRKKKWNSPTDNTLTCMLQGGNAVGLNIKWCISKTVRLNRFSFVVVHSRRQIAASVLHTAGAWKYPLDPPIYSRDYRTDSEHVNLLTQIITKLQQINKAYIRRLEDTRMNKRRARRDAVLADGLLVRSRVPHQTTWNIY